MIGVAVVGDGLGVLGGFGAAGTGGVGTTPGFPSGVGPVAPTVSIEVGVDVSTSGVRVTIVPSLDRDDEVC